MEWIIYVVELYKKGLVFYIIVSVGLRIGEDINIIEVEDIIRVLVLLNVLRIVIIIEFYSLMVYESVIEICEILNERGLDFIVIFVSFVI